MIGTDNPPEKKPYEACQSKSTENEKKLIEVCNVKEKLNEKPVGPPKAKNSARHSLPWTMRLLQLILFW